jgi:short subunit dehydrogenase-like uncharacterized protein
MKIAVYGATGFQAGLVRAELTRRAITPVLVGRDRTRLDSIAAAADLEVRVAAADDRRALGAAFSGCDAVINCAGPFLGSGLGPLRAALAAGVPYVDTNGEQPFLQAAFDATFEKSEAAAVPSASDACVPTDLVAHLIAERLGPLTEIVVSHLIAGGAGASRGSLRSIAGMFADGGRLPGKRSKVAVPEPTETVAFPLTDVITIPRHVVVDRVEGFVAAAVADRLGVPLPREVIDALPEGPAEADRRAQRFTYLVDARTRDGRRELGVIEGPDTYGTTAVIAVEAARRLVHSAKTGVLAPAEAFEPADFLGFLSAYGISWKIL